MSTPHHLTKLRRFGPEYEQLLLQAWTTCDTHEDFRLPFATPALAKSMRQKLYGYFRALRAENLRHDLIEKSDAIQVRTEDNVLVLIRVEDSWDHAAIRQALGLKKGFAYEGMADGAELHIPDIASNRLMRALKDVRARREAEKSGIPSSVVPPLKNSP